MDFAERTAKTVLEAVLAGAKLTYRVDQSDGEYDFDLLYSDGRVAVVEVTTSLDHRQAQISAAIQSKKKSPMIAAFHCKKTWMITPLQNARINIIREEADRRLAALEEAGIDEFSVLEVAESKQLRAAGLEEIFPDKILPRSVESICDRLMLRAGGVVTSQGPSPQIILRHPTYGGTVGPMRAIDAGNTEAWKQDNRKKLGRAAATERHLVVFVDVTNGLAWTALADCDPPLTCPELPPEIDQIWLIGEFRGSDMNRWFVWHGGKTEHWQKLEIAMPTRAEPPLPVP
jgi:hypothetical protein